MLALFICFVEACICVSAQLDKPYSLCDIILTVLLDNVEYQRIASNKIFDHVRNLLKDSNTFRNDFAFSGYIAFTL